MFACSACDCIVHACFGLLQIIQYIYNKTCTTTTSVCQQVPRVSRELSALADLNAIWQAVQTVKEMCIKAELSSCLLPVFCENKNKAMNL